MRGRLLTLGIAAITLLTGAQLLAAGGSQAGVGAGCDVIAGDNVTFTYQGDEPQTIQVPAEVDKASVEVHGAHGGQTSDSAPGGPGGVVYAELPVSAGQCLSVYVANWGEGTQWGYGRGGDKGDQWGAGHDGRAGGGGSAIEVAGQPVVVAGGGGGGGGNSITEFHGGAGGAGAGGAGPGTGQGGDGGNGQGVPVTTYMNLGGDGGAESGHDGGDGYPGTTDPLAGTGGGGGGGTNGGNGGSTWVAINTPTSLKLVGGGGGGGGDSWVAPSASGAEIVVDDRDCPGGGEAECQGLVKIDWVEKAADISAYAGSGQSASITTPFRSSLEARVTAASGDPVPGTEVTFNLPSTGPSATFDTTGTPTAFTASTNQNGVVTTPSLTAGDVAGPWTATATVADVDATAHFAMFNRPATTATALYANPEPSNAGEPVSLTAVVKATPSTAGDPVGIVSFEVDGKMVGNPVNVVDGVALSSPVVLAPGVQQVSANFDGSPQFRYSGHEIEHRVRKADATVSLASSQNPSSEGETVTIEATVGAAQPGLPVPTGWVQFMLDGEDVGPRVALSSGVAGTDLTFPEAGLHVVRAIYIGDGNFAPAAGTIVQSVGPEATAVTLASSASAPDFGDPLTFAATVTGAVTPSGDVTFLAETPDAQIPLCAAVGTDPSGDAACDPTEPLPAGRYEIVAEFEPDGTGQQPSTGRISQLVLPAASQTTLTAAPDPLSFGQHFGATAGVGPAVGPVLPGGQVRFTVDSASIGDPVPLETGVATLSPQATPALAAGVHPLAAKFSGDPDFRPSSGATVVTVDPEESVIRLRSNRNPSRHGAGVSLTATVAPEDGQGEVDGSVQFWADGAARGKPVNLVDGSARKTLRGLRPGVHDLRAYYSSPDDYYPSEAKLRQTVDSPLPSPEGIYPCRPWRIAVTAAWRIRHEIRVEGAARISMRGKRVHLMWGKRVLTRVTVRPDGTFWAVAPMPATSRPGRIRIHARVSGHRSRARQVAQPVEIVNRWPKGQGRQGRVRVAMAVLEPGKKRLWVARQHGCRLKSAVRLRSLVTNPAGRTRIALPRPKPGKPFFVYRLMNRSGEVTSSPIIVRAPRPSRG